eukprot:scaffold277_cov261-Pinguiococcus_pyrenoidosus.AAC.19
MTVSVRSSEQAHLWTRRWSKQGRLSCHRRGQRQQLDTPGWPGCLRLDWPLRRPWREASEAKRSEARLIAWLASKPA